MEREFREREREMFIVVSLFQSLTEDVARQTEREKQLQGRYAALQDEVKSMRTGSGKVENGHMNGHAVESPEADEVVEPREEVEVERREEMEVDG